MSVSLSQIDASLHLQYKIANADVKTWPYNHFFIENVFPDNFYEDILDALPPSDKYETGKSNYHGRKFADPAESGLFDFMMTEDFTKTVVLTFLPEFQKRFPDGHFRPQTELRLVMDGENYSIGPHTDAAWKVVSLLFYLPPFNTCSDLGTSIFVPKDPNFRCTGGPHYKFEDFSKVFTAPFLPNTCFGFFKTDRTFHGVEPIPRPVRRDVLLWNLYDASMR